LKTVFQCHLLAKLELSRPELEICYEKEILTAAKLGQSNQTRFSRDWNHGHRNDNWSFEGAISKELPQMPATLWNASRFLFAHKANGQSSLLGFRRRWVETTATAWCGGGFELCMWGTHSSHFGWHAPLPLLVPVKYGLKPRRDGKGLRWPNCWTTSARKYARKLFPNLIGH